ncbi:MAG: hypothetical protein AAFR56_14045 [Chloroflexota bacterium]
MSRHHPAREGSHEFGDQTNRRNIEKGSRKAAAGFVYVYAIQATD